MAPSTSTPVARRSSRQTAPVDRFNPAPSSTTTPRRRILKSTPSPSSRAPRPSETPASPSVLDTHGARPDDFTVAEYFAGLGLMSRWARLAVENVDRRFLAVQLVEINDAANGILRRAFPGVQIVGDMASLKKFEPCRLALAGIPCKGTSAMRRIAGNPDAMENLHTSMVEHFLRALKDTKVKPLVLLLENVPGMLSAKHEELTGGFMRWLIRNLKALGYAGEWKRFSSGDNAQSGDRIFLLCRREGVSSVRGCLLSLGGGRMHIPNSASGFGFSMVKVGDAPVQGRLACLTETSGPPCFVFAEGAEYQCVEFGIDAVSDVYTFNQEEICGDAADAKVLKMLANACRPVGKAIVKEVVECMLEVRTPAQDMPEGAVLHGGEGALPAAGYWNAYWPPDKREQIFVYPDASKIPGPTILTERSAFARTAAAFAAECLSSDPPRAKPVSQVRIIEYIEKAAMHETRRNQTSLAPHLQALFLAAFPDGDLYLWDWEVKVKDEKGRVARLWYEYPEHRAEGSLGLPHMLQWVGGRAPTPAFVCFLPGGTAIAFGVEQRGVKLTVGGRAFPEAGDAVDGSPGTGRRARSPRSEPASTRRTRARASVGQPGGDDEIGNLARLGDGGAARRGGGRAFPEACDALDGSPGTGRRARSPRSEPASTRATRDRAAVGQPGGDDEIGNLARPGDRGAARRGGGRAFPEAVDALDGSPGTRRRARSPPSEPASTRSDALDEAGESNPDSFHVAFREARGMVIVSPPGSESCSASSAGGVIPAQNLLPGGTHLQPGRGISAAGDPQWLVVTGGPVAGRTRRGCAEIQWEEEEVNVPRGDGEMGAGTQPTQSSKNKDTRGYERLQRNVLVDLESLYNETGGSPRMVWEHIDEYNCLGWESKFHQLHETKENRHRWDYTKSGRRPLSKWLTCGRCAGLAAINFLKKGQPELAQEKVDKFEETCLEYYPRRARKSDCL